jgi:hypothetical protein
MPWSTWLLPLSDGCGVNPHTCAYLSTVMEIAPEQFSTSRVAPTGPTALSFSRCTTRCCTGSGSCSTVCFELTELLLYQCQSLAFPRQPSLQQDRHCRAIRAPYQTLL